jgi:hypothetical protein
MVNCLDNELYKLLVLPVVSFIELGDDLGVSVRHGQIIRHQVLHPLLGPVALEHMQDRNHQEEVVLFKDSHLEVGLKVDHKVFEQNQLLMVVCA